MSRVICSENNGKSGALQCMFYWNTWLIYYCSWPHKFPYYLKLDHQYWYQKFFFFIPSSILCWAFMVDCTITSVWVIHIAQIHSLLFVLFPRPRNKSTKERDYKYNNSIVFTCFSSTTQSCVITQYCTSVHCTALWITLYAL